MKQLARWWRKVARALQPGDAPRAPAAPSPPEPFRRIDFHSIYPVAFAPTEVERQAVAGARIPGRCPICGHRTLFDFPGNCAENMRAELGDLGADASIVGPEIFLLRETGVCANCHSVNRERQVAHFLNRAYNLRQNVRFPDHLAILNAETTGVLHHYLARNKGYRASEYLGPDRRPGELVGGVRHEDFQALSFADNSLDLVISRDVFEHIPDPYAAHREVLRVLRPGGRHVFTVPFYDQQFDDEVRARRGPDGRVEHLLPPIHHLNPVDPEAGSLVYTIFSLETLLKLRRLGFLPRLWHLYVPEAGILGPNALVLEARKPG